MNDRIRANVNVSIQEMDAEEAFQTGAIALFEEKYGERVRVIELDQFSKELCGGTHTSKTGNIGLFKIIGETSVAAGVRRIEACTGKAALDHVQSRLRILQETAGLLKERPEALYQRVEAILSQQRTAEKEVERLKNKIASFSADQADSEIQTVNDVKVLAKRVEVENPASLRDMADKFKDRIKSGIVTLGAVNNGKALLIVVVTKDLLDRFHAGNIIKSVSAEVGGGGGGRPDMAQAGGPNPENLDRAIAKVYEIVQSAEA